MYSSIIQIVKFDHDTSSNFDYINRIGTFVKQMFLKNENFRQKKQESWTYPGALFKV